MRRTPKWKHVVAWHLWERDSGLCRFCKSPIKETDRITIHHVVKVRHGGSDHLDNLILAHDKCHKEFHLNERTKTVKIKPKTNDKILRCGHSVKLDCDCWKGKI